MPSPCAKVKTLRKIIAEVLSADDLEWANIQYCVGEARGQEGKRARVAKKICPDTVVESPIACTQSPKCQKPITVITTGLGTPPSWPVEWAVETGIVKKGWHKNIKPGGTLCMVNNAMEGHCIKFKDRFSKDERRILGLNPKMPSVRCVPLNKGGEGGCTRRLPLEVRSLPQGTKATDLLMDLAESICEISLTKQVKTIKR